MQHLAADHRPARARTPSKDDQTPLANRNDALSREPPTPSIPDQGPAAAGGLPVLVSMLLVVIIIAALSWQVAAVLTIPLFAAVLFYRERHRLVNRR